MYGRRAVLPIDVNLNLPNETLEAEEIRDQLESARALVRLNVMDAKWRQKRNHDARHRQVDFDVGDRVMVFTKTRKVGRSEKLICNWFGPKVVTKVITPVTYEVKDIADKKKSTVHVERLKRYYEDIIDDDEVWDYDTIKEPGETDG